tara:strand:- start:444 stop:722 length:279 start_codon:yes stop_codon:yes gene_type:complete
MSKEIDKLKQLAAPNSERIAVAVEALLVEQIRTNVYKEEQKQGDIKHRKLTDKQNKISLLLHLVSISIASAAFYISIAGLPGFISVWVKGVL